MIVEEEEEEEKVPVGNREDLVKEEMRSETFDGHGVSEFASKLEGIDIALSSDHCSIGMPTYNIGRRIGCGQLRFINSAAGW